jgi:hypothetical protein
MLRLTSLLSVVFALVNLAARALGGLLPPNPALAGFSAGCESQPQPCWYGIVPETTTMQAVETLLKQSPYLQRYHARSMEAEGVNCNRLWLNRGLYDAWTQPVDNKPLGLMFSGCRALTLGDFVALLGPPQLITPGSAGLYIIYTQPYMLLTAQPKNARLWLRPDTPVIAFHIGQPHYIPLASVAFQWRGFASLAAYQIWQPHRRGEWPFKA